MLWHGHQPDLALPQCDPPLGRAQPAGLLDRHEEKHDTYWKTEANMIEGNPMLILERRREGRHAAGDLGPGRPDEVA